ncbi:hypothetical protein HYN59_13045 [Flavobacterium album]|uniref:Uncharacterized protein n=1 Tax=Flavobacterium album TaxID=2175091 RepID=A0A2S1R017_9FLAO|nr:hypothetical protein [Flavobacterium album]AWH85976.1 hypothetical protein HYN59_13045 [Flavobacterium album]
MKPFSIALVFCFLSCQKSEKIVISEPKGIKPQKPSLEYLTDSLAIEGTMYTVIQGYPGSHNNLPLRILYKGDTIYTHPNFAGNGFEFEDVDRDSINDISLNQLSNVGGVKELIIFDRKTDTFREIKDFSDFPSSERLEGTKYFYSNHRMGCAGGMWGSELFYIDNFEAKSIARIFVVTCRDADYAMGVTIYKIEGKNERIMEQMVKVPAKYQNETAFFKDYWAKNYKRFE